MAWRIVGYFAGRPVQPAEHSEHAQSFGSRERSLELARASIDERKDGHRVTDADTGEEPSITTNGRSMNELEARRAQRQRRPEGALQSIEDTVGIGGHPRLRG